MGTSYSVLGGKKFKTSENSQELVSKHICQTASKISSRVPFKVWCVVLYNKFYNEIIHKGLINKLTSDNVYANDWADVVGSYVEKTCVNSSDVDFMRDAGEVYLDSDDLPNDSMSGLVVTIDHSRMPPGSCWLRYHHTTRFDRHSDLSKHKNGIEWFLNGGDDIKYTDIVCRAKIIDGHTHVPSKSIFEYDVCHGPALKANKDGYHYFSRKMIEEFYSTVGLTVSSTFNKMLPKWLNHGPAFKQTYFGCFEVDVVNSLSCPKGWPYSAEEWPKRQRNWPKKDLVAQIVDSGFHVVPIASKIQGTENPDLEWRISFRTAETMLVQSFNECQRLCLITLKIVAKEHIEPKFQDEDFISSYIMKTVVFWTIEGTDASVWGKVNMTICLSLCLEKLKHWLQIGFCPNYFIPDYNLFRTKLQRMFILGFREWLIAEIERDDWKIVFHCNSFKHLQN